MGQVGPILRVAVMRLDDAAARNRCGLPVHRRPVGRGGQHHGDRSVDVGTDEARQLQGITGDDLASPDRALRRGVFEVRSRDVRPLGLVLHTECVATEMHGLDEGGPYTGHGIENEVTRSHGTR